MSHKNKKLKNNMKSNSALVFVFAILAFVSLTYVHGLGSDYYDQSCEDFEGIIAGKVRAWLKKDPTIAASLIRLHFHDCSIRGCDASILLNHPGSERSANGSRTLRGFELIDEIKATLEKKCPGIVSCADILTAAARDATVFLQGPFWANEYGRKDGLISLAQEAQQVPMGHEDITSLIQFSQSIGLSAFDLIVLSGAHTIGRSSCASIQDRLYNYKGTRKPDPSISASYLNYLKRKCKNPSHYVDLDATTPNKFDNKYYSNLEKGMGLLYTDQLLYNDHRTTKLIVTLATQPQVFPYMFSASMVKLGGILGDADDDGEVRLQCSRTNSHSY